MSLDDAAVDQEDDPVGVGCGTGVVGDHDDGLAQVVDGLAHEVEDLAARRGVEVAGGLVGEDDVGPAGQGPGDGDPLLLTARQLAGLVLEAVAQARRCRSPGRTTPWSGEFRPGRGAG